MSYINQNPLSAKLQGKNKAELKALKKRLNKIKITIFRPIRR